MNSSIYSTPQAHFKFIHSLTNPLVDDVNNEIKSLSTSRISPAARIESPPFDYTDGVLSREGNIVVNHKLYSQHNNYKYPLIKLDTTKETFVNKSDKKSFVEYIDDTYLKALEARALMVCRYLKTNKKYSGYSQNWELLEKNLNKQGCLFKKLAETDNDIAYVVNKGDEVKFRIHDKERYMPINIYQYVVFHEMAHMSTHELQHTQHFQELLK